LDLFTLTLMLAAGVMHASWHGLVKSGADQVINLAGMGLVATVCAAVVLPFVPAPPVAVWPVLVASVILHNGYKVCLAWAYKRGDLVQAFPLARGAVPLFATAIGFVALGQVPSFRQLGGIALVSVGILLMSLESSRRAFNAPLFTATAGAGLAVASYSVLDAFGTRLYGDWLGFTAWLIVFDNLTYLGLSRAIRGPALWPNLLRLRVRILASGGLGVASFVVFLWALSRHAVGSVSAVRETSVLFAMLIGALVYHEPLSPWRAVSGILVVAGIVMIAVWK